ncbi:MAG: hypothetical protein RL095_670 [Verrucomicrobiota bacterium]|jgi:hypothetical protein
MKFLPGLCGLLISLGLFPLAAAEIEEALPVTKVEASDTFSPLQAAANLINGYGLNSEDRHDNNAGAGTMWHSGIKPAASVAAAGIPASPAWLRFDFSTPQSPESISIWNHNQSGYTNRGLRKIQLYGSADGKAWFPLGGEVELKQAGGRDEAPQTLPLQLGGRKIQSVLLVAISNWGSEVYGLSEVQFLQHREVAEEDLPFPQGLELAPSSVYRHRADGQAGREVAVNFSSGKLYQAANLEVACPGLPSENIAIPAAAKARGSFRFLLPAGVGVEKDASITLSLSAGKHRATATFVVPQQRQWTVYVYPHSHVDIGYTNTHENVEIIHKRNVRNGIRIARETAGAKEGDRYKWNPEVIWPVERYLKDATPQQAEDVFAAIKAGHLKLDAAYVNTDTSVCCDEELFQLVSESRRLERKSGVPIDTFVQVDIPGMSWGLVPALEKSGVKYVFSLYNGIDRTGRAGEVDCRPFWWIGPDGKSKVLFLQPGAYTPGAHAKGNRMVYQWCGVRDPEKIPETIKTSSPRREFLDNHVFGTLEQLQKSKFYPYDIYPVSWALADNTPLDEDLPAAVKSWNEEYAYPRLVIAGAHEIMSAFEKKYGDRIPTRKGDFTEYWTDGLGTAARLTAMNRATNERLIQADTAWTMLQPGKSPRSEIDEVWRLAILGSEHTWCYCNPSDPFFQEAIFKVKRGRFEDATRQSDELLRKALAAAPQEGVVSVVNTLSWSRGGLITVPAAESKAGDRVLDAAGAPVPSQRLSTGELAFLASPVPALGHAVYRVVAGTASAPSSPCRVSADAASDGVIEAGIDLASGDIRSLKLCGSPREFAARDGLNSFRQLPGGASQASPDSGIKVSVSEKGPLLVEWRVDSVAPGVKSLCRRVRLVAGQGWLEFDNQVDKLKVVAKEGLHFGFAFDIPSPTTRVDIPWGVMRLEEDQLDAANRNWIAMQRWLDISGEGLGVTWVSLDAPIFQSGGMHANILGAAYGSPAWIRKLEPSATVYSWAMNNHWHTNFPLYQEGLCGFRYRVQPHASGYDAGRANRFGLEQSQPLLAVAGSLPKSPAIVTLDGSSAVFVAILKSSQDGKARILRLRSVSDQDETVKLSWPAGAPRQLHLCSVNEDAGPACGGNVTIPANGFVTLRAEW